MATVLLRGVGSRYTTQVTTEHHMVIADEPSPDGDDLGPTPYELLLAALGACTSMTLLMYARRQGWPLEQVQIELTHERDCEDCDDAHARVETIRRSIRLEGALSAEQRSKLADVARKCPVHKTLAASPQVVDEVV